MMVLLTVVFYFLAVILDTTQRIKIMAGYVLKNGIRILEISDFKYCSLGDSFSTILKRGPWKI
jgi:hypothetical protein